MPNPTSAAYGMYSQETAIQQAVQELNESGYAKEHMCMMVSPKHPIATTMKEGYLMQQGKEDGAATAKMMGWLMKFGAVMIPNVGLFIRSQNFLNTLVTGKDSSSGQGNSKALVGLGFPEGDAFRFECQLRENGILLYVSCPDGTRQAVELLLRTGAREVATLGKPGSKDAVA